MKKEDRHPHRKRRRFVDVGHDQFKDRQTGKVHDGLLEPILRGFQLPREKR